MVDRANFVKSTPLRAFTGSFQLFANMLDIMKMCMKKFDAEKYFLTNLQCMKKFDAEKIFFDKLTGFLT